MLKHKFKKKYGQNFISDKNILQKIANIAEIDVNDTVVEIGAGSGNLTEALVNANPNKLIVYEIDRELELALNERFGQKISLIVDDFMIRDVKLDLDQYNNKKLVANLPYYITTPIIMKVLPLLFNKIVIMLQKEVAERFCASINSKSYNAVSVIIQYYYNIKIGFDVNRKVFYPVPNVDSAVLVLNLKDSRDAIDEQFFVDFVKKSFEQKRKTLKNNLPGDWWIKLEPVLKEMGYLSNVRAEAITVNNFVKLSNALIK